MYADKLNEAAMEARHETAIQARSDWHHSLDGVSLDSVSIDELVESAFKAGVNWLMQQPLADRLTDEEKERLKAIYFRNVYSVADVQSNFTEKCLIDALFGEELFK